MGREVIFIFGDETMTTEVGVQDETPTSTKGFGPRENADETRQAQHQAANDTPVDVNPNAILAREQGATLTLMGKNFEANAMRFNGHLNAITGVLAGEFAKKPA